MVRCTPPWADRQKTKWCHCDHCHSVMQSKKSSQTASWASNPSAICMINGDPPSGWPSLVVGRHLFAITCPERFVSSICGFSTIAHCQEMRALPACPDLLFLVWVSVFLPLKTRAYNSLKFVFLFGTLVTASMTNSFDSVYTVFYQTQTTHACFTNIHRSSSHHEALRAAMNGRSGKIRTKNPFIFDGSSRAVSGQTDDGLWI